jgi:LysM repeat protein
MSEELREEPEELHEEPVAAEETRTAGTTEERSAVERPQTRGELIKFGILVLVLVGTVLIVALSRPLIFGHIVPAIMGEGLEQPPPAVEPTDTDTADDPVYPTEAEDPTVTDAYPAPDNEQFMPSVGTSADNGYPAPTNGDENGEETAVITHTVAPSENLTRIAEQYGVTVQEIMALNNIQNPNRIEVGRVLQIPAGGNR